MPNVFECRAERFVPPSRVTNLIGSAHDRIAYGISRPLNRYTGPALWLPYSPEYEFETRGLRRLCRHAYLKVDQPPDLSNMLTKIHFDSTFLRLDDLSPIGESQSGHGSDHRFARSRSGPRPGPSYSRSAPAPSGERVGNSHCRSTRLRRCRPCRNFRATLSRCAHIRLWMQSALENAWTASSKLDVIVISDP